MKVLFGMVVIESAIGPSDNDDAPGHGFLREPVEAGRFGLDGARFQHPVTSVARQAHLKDAAERGQNTLAVNIPDRGSRGSLHLLVDSTGVRVEGEWHARKHGGSKRRVWREIHLGIDEQTLEIRAIEGSLANGRR